MKPTLDQMRRACPDVDEGLLAEHLSRLDDRYFESFDESGIADHVRGLSRLSPEHPVEVPKDTPVPPRHNDVLRNTFSRSCSVCRRLFNAQP